MKKIFFFSTIFAVLSLVSCRKSLDRINQNPNDIIDDPRGLLFNGIQLADISVTAGHFQRISGMWSGQFIGLILQYGGIYNYNITSEEANSAWSNAYVGVLNQSKLLREQTKLDPFVNHYAGISRILEAHTMGSMASLFGNIPYSQAATPGIDDPVFDQQIALFGTLQKVLDTAIADLNKITAARTLTTDMFFQGDHVRWRKVAYTLKARFYMLTKEYTNAYAAALLGIDAPNGSMIFLPPGTGTENKNILNTFIGQRAGQITFANTYLRALVNVGAASRNNAKTNEQARFNYLNFNGNSSSSSNNPGVANPTAPMPLITYEENFLTLAEAGARTIDFNTGLTNLNIVRAHLNSGNAFKKVNAAHVVKYDPYVATDFDNGGIENPTNIAPLRALLREIVEERYVSGFGTFIPFDDARRLRKSDLDISVPFPLNTTSATSHPERFIYSQNEINANSNVPSPIPGILVKTPVNQ
jgi:starch-binding outer membrane protein, SusD/RagB family